MEKHYSDDGSKKNILIGNDSEEKIISPFDVSEKDPILRTSQKNNRLVGFNWFYIFNETYIFQNCFTTIF